MRADSPSLTSVAGKCPRYDSLVSISEATLAEEMGVSKRTVRKSMKDLAARGLISLVGREENGDRRIIIHYGAEPKPL